MIPTINSCRSFYPAFAKRKDPLTLTDKELKKLKRSDLLRLLVEQSRQMEAQKAEAQTVEADLREEIRSLQEQLKCRRLAVEEAGSIAQAALSVNEVMLAAQNAADQYLCNVKKRSEELETTLSAREEECARQCDAMKAEAEAECRAKLQETNALCEAAMDEARGKIDAYWADLQGNLESFYNAHIGLQQLLKSGSITPDLSTEAMQKVLLGAQES